MTTTKKMLQAAAGAGGGVLDIADAFSTDLYTGNGSTQTITNGLDLDGEGGLVWTKSRSTSGSHRLADTERGAGYYLSSNLNWASNAGGGVSSFNSNGFSLNSGGTENGSGTTYAAWTFRKAPKFFDVVTYTGDGVAGREIAHDLGLVPGMIAVKSLGAAAFGGIDGWWFVYHRGLTTPQSGAVFFNSTDGRNGTSLWNNTSPTSASFTINENLPNYSGREYVAYLFAHDTDDDGVIKCGVYTGNGSTTGPVVTLGWEPQWLMIKRSNAAANWHIFDAARGLTTSTDKSLRPNLSSAEMGVQGTYQATATGFTVNQAYNDYNASGSTYIYMAIRAEA
tara:strand:- start:3003 stop:4013 length:1011 start_codon:yes stop_codon:yes gene_type:complete